jgi:predicted deacetylase
MAAGSLHPAPSDRGQRRLLVSIHDVTPAHAARLDRLAPLIEKHSGAGGHALLVVPDFHGAAPLRPGTAFATRLRQWAAAGCEIFLHGFTHRDDSIHASAIARMKARRMTAGEGEFLGLDYAAARQRLVDGRALVEDVCGQPVAGFIAPAWLYGDASRRAIADLGFALAEDHFRVWRPQSGEIIARGPVITYASRTRARLASSLLWSRVAPVLLAPRAVVRFAVHPHDVDSPALLAEIDRALGQLRRGRAVARYGAL